MQWLIFCLIASAMIAGAYMIGHKRGRRDAAYEIELQKVRAEALEKLLEKAIEERKEGDKWQHYL